jgi:hypothetical protein
MPTEIYNQEAEAYLRTHNFRAFSHYLPTLADVLPMSLPYIFLDITFSLE